MGSILNRQPRLSINVRRPVAVCSVLLTSVGAQIMAAVISSPRLGPDQYTLCFKKEVDEDPLYFVMGFTLKRKVLIALLVVLPRLSVAILLLIAGSLYLANTIELNELILNAMALAFVKDVDELMFSSVVAEETSSFIASVAPLRYSFAGRWPIGIRAPGELGRLFSALGFAVLILSTASKTFYASVVAAEDRLCGGEQAFVHQHHPDHGLPVFLYLDQEPYYKCYWEVCIVCPNRSCAVA